MRKSYDVKQDFSICVKSLKIALNFPEVLKDSKTWIMDCLVFLDEVNVSDLANRNWRHKDLLVYKKDEAKRIASVGLDYDKSGAKTARPTVKVNTESINVISGLVRNKSEDVSRKRHSSMPPVMAPNISVNG